MDNLVDIVRTIIDKLPRELKIINVVDSTLFVCETTGWLTIGKVISINALEYKINSIENNVSLTVEPFNHSTPVALDTTEVIQHEITYFHGKPSSVNNEYSLKDEYTRNKTPFSWVYENYEYTGEDTESAFAAEFNGIRIFFLDWTKVQEWNNDEHNKYVIKPMENLAKMVVAYIKEDYSFRRPENYRIKPHTRFGVDRTNKGDDKKIINEDLSGVELNISLQLYNLDFCKC